MRNENEFNAYLSKNFRKMYKRVKYTKVSDRFTPGVSDFLVWFSGGNSAALECKYVQSLGDEDKPALQKHPFTPAQINFLRDIASTGNVASGLIFVNDIRKMFLIPLATIEASKGRPTPKQIRAGLEMPATALGVEALVVALGG